MTSDNPAELLDRKAMMRRQAYDARDAQENKEELSEIIIHKIMLLPEYEKANTVLWYLNARSEVHTQDMIADALDSSKRIIVPYCTIDEYGQNKLGLWHLEDVDEMVVGEWNIPGPPKERWEEPGKAFEAEDLDLVIVPGVGFDRRGGRMGNGQGYYDRLLESAHANVSLIAPAFECQLFEEIPMESFDVYMDKVITEDGIYGVKID